MLAASGRDPGAIQAFIREQAQELVTFAYLVGSDAEGAKDAVQSVLARILAHPEPTQIRDLGAYARRAILNELASVGRQKTRQRHQLEAARSADRGSPDLEEVVSRRLDLWSAMKALPERQRSAIVLRFYEDAGYAQIGKIMECSRATARSLVSRGLDQMRAQWTWEEQE